MQADISVMHKPTAKKSRGLSLLEVLIALVIISLGLLGLAALQVSSMKKTTQTRVYDYAASSLQDLSERLAANASAAKAGYFDYSNLANTDGTLPTDYNCAQSICTTEQNAKYILRTWAVPLSTTLPSPRFSVAKTDMASGALMTLTLTWDANLSGTGAQSCNTQSVDGAQCHEVKIWLN